MLKNTLGFMLFCFLLNSASAMAEDTHPVARFEGGFGVSPVAFNLARTNVEANMALGFVRPARFPWVISGLIGNVSPNGKIVVVGRGLLNAGGPNIGSNRTIGQVPLVVFASLFCGGNQFDSDNASELDADGNFRIDGFLSSTPPVSCVNPVLLIRNAVTGDWHAAGIPKRHPSED